MSVVVPVIPITGPTAHYDGKMAICICIAFFVIAVLFFIAMYIRALFVYGWSKRWCSELLQLARFFIYLPMGGYCVVCAILFTANLIYGLL